MPFLLEFCGYTACLSVWGCPCLACCCPHLIHLLRERSPFLVLSEVCDEYLPFLYFTKYIFTRVQFWRFWRCFWFLVCLFFGFFCFAFFFVVVISFGALWWVLVGLILWVVGVSLAFQTSVFQEQNTYFCKKVQALILLIKILPLLKAIYTFASRKASPPSQIIIKVDELCLDESYVIRALLMIV